MIHFPPRLVFDFGLIDRHRQGFKIKDNLQLFRDYMKITANPPSYIFNVAPWLWCAPSVNPSPAKPHSSPFLRRWRSCRSSEPTPPPHCVNGPPQTLKSPANTLCNHFVNAASKTDRTDLTTKTACGIPQALMTSYYDASRIQPKGRTFNVRSKTQSIPRECPQGVRSTCPESPRTQTAAGISLEELRTRLDYDPEAGTFTTRADGSNAARKTNTGYVRVQVVGIGSYHAHHLALFYMTGKWPKPQNVVDHINRIRDDNRFANLREATQTENNRNRDEHPNNTSGYRGVTWNANKRLWMASITVNKKRIRLGYFERRQEAAEVYRQRALLEFGEFAPDYLRIPIPQDKPVPLPEWMCRQCDSMFKGREPETKLCVPCRMRNTLRK